MDIPTQGSWMPFPLGFNLKVEPQTEGQEKQYPKLMEWLELGFVR